MLEIFSFDRNFILPNFWCSVWNWWVFRVKLWSRLTWINARTHLLLHPVSCPCARFGQTTELICKMGHNYNQQQFLIELLKLKRLQNVGDWFTEHEFVKIKYRFLGLTFLPFQKTLRDGWWSWWVEGWVLHWGFLYFTREFQAGQWTILEVRGSLVSYESEQRVHITSNCTLESDGLMFHWMFLWI